MARASMLLLGLLLFTCCNSRNGEQGAVITDAEVVELGNRIDEFATKIRGAPTAETQGAELRAFKNYLSERRIKHFSSKTGSSMVWGFSIIDLDENKDVTRVGPWELKNRLEIQMAVVTNQNGKPKTLRSVTFRPLDNAIISCLYEGSSLHLEVRP